MLPVSHFINDMLSGGFSLCMLTSDIFLMKLKKVGILTAIKIWGPISLLNYIVYFVWCMFIMNVISILIFIYSLLSFITFLFILMRSFPVTTSRKSSSDLAGCQGILTFIYFLWPFLGPMTLEMVTRRI